MSCKMTQNEIYFEEFSSAIGGNKTFYVLFFTFLNLVNFSAF